jgi:rhodanese-related sulfurtransferase
VTEARRVLTQALAIAALAVIVGAAVNVPLIKRFAKGEFRETFFVQADYPGLRLITLQETEDLWRTGVAAFVDARAAELYAQGHVPGALSAPPLETEASLPTFFERLPYEGPVVIYCEGGDCHSSLALAKRLHERGFTDLRVFGGGWEEWRAAGLPEETGHAQE